MPDPLKYARVERERRFLVASVPDGVAATQEIVDRYVTGTRLRLREVRTEGQVVRKLGQKIRLGEGPAAIACTNLYLDEREWAAVANLPARVLRKKRHVVQRDGWRIAVDEHENGILVAEIDDGASPPCAPPAWLTILRDVTEDERWTGAALAR